MKIIYDNDIKILTPKTETNLKKFLENITLEINKEAGFHFIIDISDKKSIKIEDILLFLTLSRSLRENNISFVIVSENMDLEDIPEDLIIAPSLSESKDIIEIEKIERDLEI